MRIGDIVKLRHTDDHIWGIMSEMKEGASDILKDPYVLLYYKVPFNYVYDEFNPGYYKHQNIFIRGDSVICFSAEDKDNYIVSVHGNIFTNDNYLTFDEHSDSAT